jgi:hypothetical protein
MTSLAMKKIKHRMRYSILQMRFLRSSGAVPYVPVLYIGSPAPLRWEAWQGKEADDDKALCESGENMYFINTDFAYLGNDGFPVDSLFLQDGLHLNPEGYLIWKSLIKDQLDRVLNSPAQNNPSTER